MTLVVLLHKSVTLVGADTRGCPRVQRPQTLFIYALPLLADPIIHYTSLHLQQSPRRTTQALQPLRPGTRHHLLCQLPPVPGPDLLDQKTWKNGVLPEIAYRLGMRPLTGKMGDLDEDDLRAAVIFNQYLV